MADPSTSSPFATDGYVFEYTIPFAKQLPPEGFTVDWVDWGPTPCECVVIPRVGTPEAFAQIQSVVKFEYIDEQGQPDADAAQLLPQPGDLKKGLYKLTFVVEPYHTESARDVAKSALYDRNGSFRLRAKLKWANLIEKLIDNLAVGGNAPTGVGGLLASLPAAAQGPARKSGTAVGKVKLVLEPPPPVIWSDDLPPDEHERRVTVDTSSEEGAEFEVRLYEYDKDAKKYRQTDEVLDASVESVDPFSFEVTSEIGKVTVKSTGPASDPEQDDPEKLWDKPKGWITLTRSSQASGPKAFNEPFKIPIYLAPPCRISWTWWPTDAAANGSAAEGNEDAPIYLTLDGTDRHGFRLQFRCERKTENGYVAQDADFTQYLAPDEPRVTPAVLTMVDGLPWDRKPPADLKLADTGWRTQNLKDTSLLSQLPIETSIRVRAWGGKITQHYPANAGSPAHRPDTDPPKAPQLAVRKIPLILVPASSSSSSSSSSSPGKIHLRVRVRPRDLDKSAGGQISCQGAPMTLKDPSVIDAFIKSFDIYIDLNQ